MNPMELERRYGAHNYEPLLVVLARGEGAYLWDTAGRRYVDMMSAYSTASHGHSHPRIIAALESQARRLSVRQRDAATGDVARARRAPGVVAPPVVRAPI